MPMPSDYIIPNSRANNAAALLARDSRTLWQTQPLTHCTASGDVTAIAAIAPVDLYGNGIDGMHGGSGLSSIGGAIRAFELNKTSLTGSGPYENTMRHALKMILDSRESLARCGNGIKCYRWPATKADSNAESAYGTLGNSAVPEMRMGALLALRIGRTPRLAAAAGN